MKKNPTITTSFNTQRKPLDEFVAQTIGQPPLRDSKAESITSTDVERQKSRPDLDEPEKKRRRIL